MTTKLKNASLIEAEYISWEYYVIFVVLSCVILFLCGLFVNFCINLTFTTKKYSVSSQKVKQNIRIIQVADLHNSSYGENNENLINAIKELNPDIIIMSGDMVNSRDKSTETPILVYKACVEIAPTYFVYGNNECRSTTGEKEGDNRFGYTLETLPDRTWMKWGLTYVGINVLQNEVASVTIGETVVDIFGVLTSNVDSFKKYVWEDFEKYASEDDGHLKITVCHEPYIFEEIGTETFVGDVCLAGHTHGGEVRLPILGPVYEKKHGLFAGSKYFVYGEHDLAHGKLFVSAGLINRDFLRVMNRPELNVIDIIAE